MWFLPFKPSWRKKSQIWVTHGQNHPIWVACVGSRRPEAKLTLMGRVEGSTGGRSEGCNRCWWPLNKEHNNQNNKKKTSRQPQFNERCQLQRFLKKGLQLLWIQRSRCRSPAVSQHCSPWDPLRAGLVVKHNVCGHWDVRPQHWQTPRCFTTAHPVGVCASK